MKILIISDIHGNLPALKTILENISFDELIVLGDLVDYGPFPAEVIDLLRSYDAMIVRGNHDHAVAYGVDCRSGKATHWVSVWFRENITYKLLSKNDVKYLANLPIYLVRDNKLFIHASPIDPLYDYFYPWIGLEELLKRISNVASEQLGNIKEYKSLFIGHTHIQFLLRANGKTIINPGSIGQPRDGDPRASYALLIDEKIVFGRMKYPIEKTIRRYEELGVPDPYYSFLKYLLLHGSIPKHLIPKEYQ
jgi:predicted phosphodiesterase